VRPPRPPHAEPGRGVRAASTPPARPRYGQGPKKFCMAAEIWDARPMESQASSKRRVPIADLDITSDPERMQPTRHPPSARVPSPWPPFAIGFWGASPLARLRHHLETLFLPYYPASSQAGEWREEGENQARDRRRLWPRRRREGNHSATPGKPRCRYALFLVCTNGLGHSFRFQGGYAVAQPSIPPQAFKS
jgi:hypothetical protein